MALVNVAELRNHSRQESIIVTDQPIISVDMLQICAPRVALARPLFFRTVINITDTSLS